MLSERRKAEEEGTAVAWALCYMRFGHDAIDWPLVTKGMSRTALIRIKRRMWQHIEANRSAESARAPEQRGETHAE